MKICYTVGLAVRIFPATMRTFTKDTELSEQGRGAAWNVWINGWHGRGMLCLNRPLRSSSLTPFIHWPITSVTYSKIVSKNLPFITERNPVSYPYKKTDKTIIFWDCLTLEDGPRVCPETSVNDYQSAPCSIPEQQISLFWVIAWRLNFICRRFETLCSILIGR